MAFSYDLVGDFKFGPNGNVATVTSTWVLMVIPYVQITGDKSFLIKGKYQYDTATNSTINPNTVLPSIVIDHACENLNIRSSKNSPQGTLTAILKPDRDYLKIMHPGDWIIAWICQSQQDINNVLSQIQTLNNGSGNTNLNSFGSGLKFVGKIDTIDQNMSISRNGTKNLEYSVNAYSFTEFDHEITYFYQIGQENNNDPWSVWLSRLGIIFNKIIEDGETAPGLLYPQFLQAFFGDRVSNGYTNQDPNTHLIELPLTANQPYIIPNLVYSLFNSKSQANSGSNHYFKEILNAFIGIQKYNSNGAGLSNFLPIVSGKINASGSNVYSTPDPMIGKIPPIPPVLDFKPVWNVLQEFLNPAMNEMYTTLRVGDTSGNIYPTFVSRQKPFTTDEFIFLLNNPQLSTQANNTNFTVTPYTSLPVWSIDDEILVNYSIGSTNALRHNLIDIIGVSKSLESIANDPAIRFTIDGPKWNSADIARNGIRAYSSIVNASVSEIEQTTPQWIGLNGDVLMNQELHLGGSFAVHGIQSPICIGDNLMYGDVLYHIESVTHACNQDNFGNKSFFTTLTVTNGLNAAGALTNLEGIYPTTNDENTSTVDTGDQPAIDTINR